MRAFSHVPLALTAAVVLIGLATVRSEAGEIFGTTGGTGSGSNAFHMTVQAVDSQGSPIAGATVLEIALGVHPNGYQPPSHTTDAKGYATVSGDPSLWGVAIQADGFFGARIGQEAQQTDGTKVVRLRRTKLKGQQLSANGLATPACEFLSAPAELTDADVLSAIQTAAADPRMRPVPPSFRSIRIVPGTAEAALTSVQVTFTKVGGWWEGYTTGMTLSKEGWRVEWFGLGTGSLPVLLELKRDGE
jgi:hypothetical protein